VPFSFDVAIEVMTELVSQHQVSSSLLHSDSCYLVAYCTGPIKSSGNIYCSVSV